MVFYIVSLRAERGTLALRLYNNTKFTVAVGVKSPSKLCTACILLLNVNNYGESFERDSSYS
jgi:hypothetical protein